MVIFCIMLELLYDQFLQQCIVVMHVCVFERRNVGIIKSYYLVQSEKIVLRKRGLGKRPKSNTFQLLSNLILKTSCDLAFSTSCKRAIQGLTDRKNTMAC